LEFCAALRVSQNSTGGEGWFYGGLGRKHENIVVFFVILRKRFFPGKRKKSGVVFPAGNGFRTGLSRGVTLNCPSLLTVQ
jgi:hypothetical protein